MKRLFLILFVVVFLAVALSGCSSSEANVASQNLSTAADQFQVVRRIVFYNGITDTYMLTVEGLCSLGNYDTANELTVTCKVGDGLYVKHFLGLSDNISYFVQQMEPKPVSEYRYKTIFRPSVIVPDIDIELGW